MENQILTSIWASSELTEEEKIMLSKRIAQEMKEAEYERSNGKSQRRKSENKSRRKRNI